MNTDTDGSTPWLLLSAFIRVHLWLSRFFQKHLDKPGLALEVGIVGPTYKRLPRAQKA